MDRFLVQISRDLGYANITDSRLYRNELWSEKPRDEDHGKVKAGDELLIYCTQRVPKHGKSLAFSIVVNEVSTDNVTFKLDNPRWFSFPLKLEDIRDLLWRDELPDVFLGCGQQGFNIAKIEPGVAEKVLSLANTDRGDWAESTKPPQINARQTLANNLHFTSDFLENIETLLTDKKQIIFQGPPGTGKTYVAQALAGHLAGSEDRVTLVQFHPSYAYEDFVRGFRPKVSEDGQPGFELKDGPLLNAAKRAEEEPNEKHYLIIDEINRGNLAKVFGELYFLLEYRDEKITLQYRRDEDEEKFSLPSNLYIIGTMNTADRSIALVDLALRRRFYFVEFHPDDEPVRGVLGRWLEANAPDMDWVAGVVERANELLKDDRHAAIGPSYFMKDRLDDAMVERIWKHSVLPYIEERRFGGDEVSDEFDLDKLKASVQTQAAALRMETMRRTDSGGASDASA